MPFPTSSGIELELAVTALLLVVRARYPGMRDWPFSSREALVAAAKTERHYIRQGRTSSDPFRRYIAWFLAQIRNFTGTDAPSVCGLCHFEAVQARYAGDTRHKVRR
jgi:hypothetical protein